MKKCTKRCFISAVLAAVLMAGLLYLADQPSNGPNIFTTSVLPFYMIGVLFSGNAHEPSEIPTYISMYLFFFVIVYAALFIWSKIVESHDA
jgi:glucan phosphoethanolaminetransferase (alkaline phosphatase superfamily)